MQSAYLLFDLLVLAGPLGLSLLRGPTQWFHRWSKASVALLAAAPWVLWDVLVTGRHWDFSEAYVLGPRVASLPLEEWGFFVVVPFACLFSWEILLRGPEEAPRGGPTARWVEGAFGALGMVAGAAAASWLPPYTSLALMSTASALVVDAAADTGVFLRVRGAAYAVLVAALTVVFNNVLTGLPIVVYVEEAQLGWRIVTMPVEDLGFGLGLVGSVTVAFEALLRAERRDPSVGLVARVVRWRLGGYRHAVHLPDPRLPERPEREVRVLVVGGGLAGIGAAEALASRGVSVTLREREDSLGGKVRAWEVPTPRGPAMVEHGFHAFFRQYWNQRELLARADVPPMRSIGDYLILTNEQEAVSFAGTSPVPVLNLLSLARVGVYSFWQVAVSGTGEKLEALLRYDRDATAAAYDHISFADFADDARLPRKLRLVFTTFARAFFADGRRMSMGELIKSFHFFYLSNDRGLIYDFPVDDYERALIGPLRRRLEALGVQWLVNAPVSSVARHDDGVGLVVDGERFDHVVWATDVKAVRAVLAKSALLDEAPAFAASIASLKAGQRYAVWRLWFDRPAERPGWPVFVITEREQVLDSITLYHRITADARAWAEERGGSVVELHCYAVPDDLPDEALRGAFLEELARFLPELAGAQPVVEHLQIRDDFPAFHTGAWPSRPETVTGVRGLVLAGDWVKLPWPAMLMEAAQMSALHAANQVLAAEGLRGHTVWSVPPKGVLTGLPEAPKRG
jgi:isorenieratene synthase